MDRDQIRKTIEAEITRQELQELQAENRTLFEKLSAGLKHPITLTLFGFLLTSIVGTLISQSIADRAQRDDERTAALQAVQSFASAAAELRVQQEVFEAALRRSVATDELSALKSQYEASYVAWNSERYKSYLSIRSFFGFTYSNFAEQLISRTIHQDFKAVNTCLVRSYDWALGQAGTDIPDRAAAVTQQIDACLTDLDRPPATLDDGTNLSAFERRQEEIFQCSRQIFDPLHHYISQDYNCAHPNWSPQGDKKAVIEVIYDKVWNECGVGAKKPFNTHGGASAYCTISKGGWPLSLK